MVRFERRRAVLSTATFTLVCGLVTGWPTFAGGDDGSDWEKPFRPDGHTVVLYHFDEGQGNDAYDACGDAALTLRAHMAALWGSRPGFGTTATFARRADDADVRVGPANNDKLHLKTCTEAWTIEAWIRYTGPGGQEQGGRTYANICGTDDEGFGLREGMRGGYSFTLNLGRGGVGKREDGLLPTGRFIASSQSTENFGTSSFLFPYLWPNKVKGRHIADDKWHHVAWQFRYKDQLNTFFLDGRLMAKISLHDPGSPGIIVNNTKNICVPFTVGGWIHSQNPPFYIKSGNFQGEIDELRISKVMRYPVARKLAIVRQKLPRSLPPAFAGSAYETALKTTFMARPARWEVVSGTLPKGIAFDGATGKLHGTPTEECSARVAIQVTDANGVRDRADLVLRVLPQELRVMKADANTVVLYDWQGPNGKLIPDLIGNKELTLTWTAMGGDRRVPWPGRKGRFPQDNGHGEHGWVTKVKGNPVLDLKTCKDEWTVEAWVRRGGPIQAHGKKVDKTHQPFDYGHICGSYDNSKRGVWELYLSDHDSPDGSMAPGVHFLGAEPDQALMDLHPWKRAEGIVGNLKDAGISDTEWHHVAWQYNYAEDLHQLFLDGKLIWQMQSPDGRKLVNNREHAAQFSVSTRLTGDVLYGVNNFLGFGNFFGQIGEIRISNTRRY